MLEMDGRTGRKNRPAIQNKESSTLNDKG